MSRKPAKPAAKTPAAKPANRAAKPVEVVGQTIERALDPLASALKRAGLKRADKIARAFDTVTSAPAKVDKSAMPVSPLAVPFPKMKPIPPADAPKVAPAPPAKAVTP